MNPLADGVATTTPASATPKLIGPYRILRVLSTGGMGTVFEATQQRPHRTVALKTVRADFLTPDALRRFQDEIEVLARLRHPGIAQIYDAGLHAEGSAPPTPYFAMEYVPDPEPITLWVQQRSLSIAQKLRLFAAVCDAVHHAHSQGVVHRDLKPANILMTASQETPLPKIIDFGIAHVTQRDAVLTTMSTVVGEILGTLQYMSPEQLAGRSEAIDVRSDIYTLGLLLFELLAGRPPCLVAGLPLPEAVRLLTEHDAPRLGRLDPALQGDLEWIVAKALEKVPSRRYASAEELAADVRRHLADEPILARAPTRAYRIRKFAKRNTMLVGIVSFTILALLIGFVSLLALVLQEGHARHAAERQAYASSMVAAGTALEQWRLDDALALLMRAPPALRGWEWRVFRQRADPRPPEVDVACGVVHAFGVSSDGTRYVTTCADGKLYTWDARDVHQLQAIRLPRSTGVLFVRGRYVAAASGPGTFPGWIGLWDVRDGALVSMRTGDADDPVRPPRSPADWVHDVNAEGVALIGDDPHRFLVRDLVSGRILSEWKSDRVVLAARWSADGSRLAVGFEDGRIDLLDGHSLRGVASFRSSLGTLHRVWLDREGRRLAATSTDGVVQLWPRTTAVSEPITLQGRGRPIQSLDFSGDGSLIAMASDQIVRLWRTSDGRSLKSLGVTPTSTGIAFRPDGRELLVASSDGRIRSWDVRSIELPVLRGHASYVYSVAFTPDASLIVSGGWDGFVGRPGSVRVWDAATGEPVVSLGLPGQFVRAAAVSPEGNVAAFAVSRPTEHSVALLDLRTGEFREVLPPGPFWVESMAFSPDGRTLALAAVSGLVRIVDVSSGRILLERRLGTQDVWFNQPRVAWRPDGRSLAVSFEGGIVELLDAVDLSARRQFPGHTDVVRCLAFSPDGRLLASASKDTTIRVWDVDKGTAVVQLRGHDEEVLAAAFSPDGRRLATGGYDAKVRIWDTETWDQVAVLAGHEWYVYSLAWSADGERLVSGSGDGTVRIWEPTPDAARDAARRARDEMRDRIAPVVQRWLEQLGDGRLVSEWIRTTPAFSSREREIAREVLLAESVARLGGAVAQTSSSAR